jgi:hypothetical protein
MTAADVRRADRDLVRPQPGHRPGGRGYRAWLAALVNPIEALR